jgi:hypothetical protein
LRQLREIDGRLGADAVGKAEIDEAEIIASSSFQGDLFYRRYTLIALGEFDFQIRSFIEKSLDADIGWKGIGTAFVVSKVESVT